MKSLGPAVPELIILPVYSALPSEMQAGAGPGHWAVRLLSGLLLRCASRTVHPQGTAVVARGAKTPAQRGRLTQPAAPRPSPAGCRRASLSPRRRARASASSPPTSQRCGGGGWRRAAWATQPGWWLQRLRRPEGAQPGRCTHHPCRGCAPISPPLIGSSLPPRAQASLTIDGIYYVVDPGFAKQKVFNPKVRSNRERMSGSAIGRL